MSTNRISSKITPAHLSRKAVVYLRQSSEQQVQTNTESQRLQYALVDRAQALGFARVDVIDQDLGLSASVGAKQRPGFQALLASIVLGEVGLVLSRELSRLSRTDKDWCQLQEVCQVFGVLLGDDQQVYDLSLMDDQLVLGVKGTMSVLELNVLKLRLQEGMQAKARRGELIRLLPPGYVRDGEGQVVKDPDTRVREAIELIFGTFRTAGSLRQTHLWFHSQGVQLPVNKRRGEHMQIVWQLPSLPLVSGVLHNPFYAGAYVWGRRPAEMKWMDDRLVRTSGSPRPAKDCKVFIRDHHEAYIGWEEYEENLRHMRANNLRLDAEASVAAARSGQGLLTRLLRCGRCGRKLHVRYWGRGGTAARYACLGDYHQGGSYCLAFGGSTVDQRFCEELLKVISPWSTRASLEALERKAPSEAAARQALERQLQEVEYAAQRAFEQYDEADPRNRLVAAQLEQRWNAKLEEVETLTAQLAGHDVQQEPLSTQQQEAILLLGEHFAAVWHSDACPSVLKKKIIRTVIEEVIVEEEAESKLVFTIHWKGGVHTRFEMPKPPSGVGRKTALEDLDIIRRLAPRYGDDEIARVLSKLKRRTATGKRWNALRVTSVRARYKISGQRRSTPDPDVLSLAQAAQYGGVSDTTIRRLVEAKLLDNHQDVPWAPWEIQRQNLDAEPVRSLIAAVRQTGKLDLLGVRLAPEPSLFDPPHREEHTQVS